MAVALTAGALAGSAHAADRVYWANEVGNTAISFARLDNTGGGGDLNTTGATFETPEGLTLDPLAGRIYWVNTSGEKVSFAMLNGTGGGGDLNTTGATVSNPDFPLLLEAPRNLKAPAIKGGSAPGSKLSCSHGSWGADLIESFLYRAPHSFAFHWSRDGKDIPGATGSSFTAKTPGVYRCRVTATNIAGSTPKTSRPHVVKAKPKPPKPKPPKHHCGHDQDVLRGVHCQKHDDDDDDADVRHAASFR